MKKKIAILGSTGSIGISTLEVIYNVIDRRIENKVLKHKRKELSIIARVPLCMSFLTRKYLEKLPEYKPNDFRSNIKKEHSDWLVKSVRELKFLDKLEGGISNSAIRFCLSNKNIFTVIPGMRSVRQVQCNLAAESLGPLDKRIREKIKKTIKNVHPDW